MIKTLFDRYNSIYNNIHKYFSNKTTYTVKDNSFLPENPPKKPGLYVVYEESEEDYRRIVRVGIATKSLYSRLKQHFINLNRSSSIFRKHIGRALINLNNSFKHINIKDWNNKKIKSAPTLEEVEREVSNYMQNHLSFTFIEINNGQELENAEKKLIEFLSIRNSLFSQATGKQPFSNDWLGQYCTNKKVNKSGLWNDEYVQIWKNQKISKTDNLFIDNSKKYISCYIKYIESLLQAENLSAQKYYEKYGINDYYKSKTSADFGYNGKYLKFIFERAFELGYLTSPNDNILHLVQTDLDKLIKQNYFENDSPIAECSTDLD